MADFRIKAPGISDILGGGIQTGLGIGNIITQTRAAEAERVRQAEIKTALTTLSENPNPTAKEIFNVSLLLPENERKVLLAQSEQMTEEKRRNQNALGGQVLAAMDVNTEIAYTLLKERETALLNSGDEKGAKATGTWAELVKLDKDSASKTIATMLSITPEGRKIVESYIKLRDTRRGVGAGEKAFAPVTLVNTKTGEKIPFIPAFDPVTGSASLKEAALPEGFILSLETPEEKRQGDVLAARQKEGQKVTGKGIAEKRLVAIEKGIDASEGMANLIRAEQLLNEVSTGGVDAVSLRAKQFFGVEGANEAELSNRLLKAVLSQLRITFGAQFTEGEGRRLEVIEAGIGKSTEGNKRLVRQTMKIIERAAKRGIRAAEKIGDLDSAEDIRENLAFRLDTEQPSVQVETPTGQPVQGATNVGKYQVRVKE